MMKEKEEGFNELSEELTEKELLFLAEIGYEVYKQHIAGEAA